MTAERWNQLLADALTVVRASNPDRAVIVRPVRWNIPGALPTLRLPDDDRLVVTVHYYSPFRFTHQGADWLEGAGEWLGTSWGTEAERLGIGWAYWDFATDFGAFDIERDAWRAPLRQALLG